MTDFGKNTLVAVFSLVFFTTMIATILVGLGLFENADPSLFKGLLAGGFGQMGIFGAVAWVFRESFRRRDGSAPRVYVNLTFGDTQVQLINLDQDNCSYQLKDDETGRVIGRGPIAPTLEAGSWQCRLPATVDPTNQVKLFLDDTNGNHWETKWFAPLTSTEVATQVQDRGVVSNESQN